MLGSIRGIIAFKAVGAGGEAFMNAIMASSVAAFNVKSVGGSVNGEVCRRQYADLLFIAKKHGMTVNIAEKKGLIFVIIRYKKRYGIILGGILAAAMIALLSNTVLSIEIEGNSSVTNEQVLELLDENGIAYGRFIPGLDFPEIERSVTSSAKTVSRVGIRRSGGMLVVEVDEIAKKPKIIAKHMPCNIVSMRSAQLVRAEVYRGALVPKIGEGITKGQLLISGMHTDNLGKSTAHHAHGKIIGRYTETADFSQSFSEERRMLSGDSIKKHSIIFFGMEIPLGLKAKIDGEYDVVESVTYFSFFSLQLPIGILHKTYSPFSVQMQNHDKEAAEALLLQKIADYEENLYKDDTIISKEIVRNDAEEAVSVKVFYTIEGEIGREQEILVKS